MQFLIDLAWFIVAMAIFPGIPLAYGKWSDYQYKKNHPEFFR